MNESVHNLQLISNKNVTIIYNETSPDAFNFLPGLSTGFVAILLVGLSYLLVGLIDQIGIDKTFRILSLVFFITCLVAAQAFLPVDFSTDRGTEEEKKEKEATIYLKLLRNKRFAIFLSMNFIFSFSYAVSYVHQVRIIWVR